MKIQYVKITITLLIAILLCSCSLTPGMQNLNVAQFHREPLPAPIPICPILTIITPALIATQRARLYNYKVAPSDVLQINVWEHPEFNLNNSGASTNTTAPGAQGAAGKTGYLVNAQGRIYFPLIGYVTVGGKTVDQIRHGITLPLKKFIPNPQVNVRVADYRGRKVYIMGEVKKSGILQLNDQALTIADALALSGIEQQFADPKHIYVIRGTVTQPRVYWLNAETPDRLLLAERFTLQPKDILYVSTAPTTQWNRILTQLLPTLDSFWYTNLITTP